MRNTRKNIITVLNQIPVSKDTLVGVFFLLILLLMAAIMFVLIPFVPGR